MLALVQTVEFVIAGQHFTCLWVLKAQEGIHGLVEVL